MLTGPGRGGVSGVGWDCLCQSVNQKRIGWRPTPHWCAVSPRITDATDQEIGVRLILLTVGLGYWHTVGCLGQHWFVLVIIHAHDQRVAHVVSGVCWLVVWGGWCVV